MAAPARQPVLVHYRRLEDVTKAFGARTLEAAIRHAMNHKVGGQKISGHWKSRAWIVPPSSEDTYLMNLNHDGSGYYFGDLTHYTKGYMQALLAQADKPILAVEQLPPPKGKEYVHSMMYWLVTKNHALMIQSRSLGSKHLEEYLTWLLKAHTKTIGDTGQVLLQAKFDPDEVGGDLDDIRQIIVGGAGDTIVRPVATPSEPKVRETETYREIGTRKPWRERALDVLRAVMNNEADVQKLLESLPEGANLEVAVHIG